MDIGRKNTIVLISFESLCQLTFLQPPTWRQSVRISGSCVPPIQSVTPKVALEPGLLTFEKVSLRESLKTRAAQFFFQVYFSQCAIGFISHNLPTNAQCVVCKVHCHCIFYGPGIRYSDIFGAPGIRYSVIIKLPCALLQTGHLETVHAPVADTVAYFADLDAPVVDTVTYFGGNHRSRV